MLHHALRPLLLALLGLATACPDKDDTTDGAATESTGDASSSSDTDAGATEASSSGSTGGSSGDASSSSGGGAPVACGDGECAPGELCVLLGEKCDYNQTPPAVVQPAPVCKPPPPNCAADDVDCLGAALCTFVDALPAELMGGTLDCPPTFWDCF